MKERLSQSSIRAAVAEKVPIVHEYAPSFQEAALALRLCSKKRNQETHASELYPQPQNLASSLYFEISTPPVAPSAFFTSP